VSQQFRNSTDNLNSSLSNKVGMNNILKRPTEPQLARKAVLDNSQACIKHKSDPLELTVKMALSTPFKAVRMQRYKKEKRENEAQGFSKISTHLGDVDHNPSTPKSNNSSFSNSSGHEDGGGLSGSVAAMNENFFRGGILVGQNEES